VNGEAFIGVMGVGFDASIAHRFETIAARGLRTYVQVGLSELRAFTPEQYEITIDGETLRERATVVAIANTAQYGNNIKIAPRASVRDGRLDLTLIREISLVSAVTITARTLTGTLADSRTVLTRQFTEAIIRREHDGPAHLDGEPVLLPRELHIRVRPQSLNVLVPQLNGQ